LRLKGLSVLGLLLLFVMAGFFQDPAHAKWEGRNFSDVKAFFKGTDQEVEVYHQAGHETGPTVLIFAGIHGDESAGYLTADRYVGLKVLRGSLIIVPRLNLYAILTGKRAGLSGGDMNRKFHLAEEEKDPDVKVVSLAKSLMDRADIILNLHQGHGFYSPVWVNKIRNPVRWGQSNIIDVRVFSLPDGRRLELECFAREVVRNINAEIKDKDFHFQVNNTNTFSQKSLHKEQKGSLTYYALAGKHKMAFGIDATHNCSLPAAVGFLTKAVNEMVRRAGVVLESSPSASLSVIQKELKRNEEFSGLKVKINHLVNHIPPKSEILLSSGDRFQILSVEARHSRGWYPAMPSFHVLNGTGRVFSIRENDRLVLQKDGKRVAVFPIRVSEPAPQKSEMEFFESL